MEERRRSVRTELQAELFMRRLDREDEEKVNIQIRDVSTGGVGFWCDRRLEVGVVYDCVLTIWTKEVIHCFLKIVRSVEEEDRYMYGGVFVGMTEMDTMRIQVYQTVEEYRK
ncbi:MAG: PilZ domain-containing protein [Clostridiales bacterium]|nr:PilZ domain-containing protein [Clostridiales bacterium]